MYSYVTNEAGERVAVQIQIEDYYRLLEELEELESTIAFDAAMASGEEPVRFDEVLAEIEASALHTHPSK